MLQNPAGPTLKSEISLLQTWTKQERTYKDCRHYWLDEEERERWIRSASPALASFQVFSCGLFVEAWEHMWERDGLPEGILVYCVDGKGYFHEGDRDWAIRAGDMFYAPPYSHHLYWADGREPWTIYWMHLSGPGLTDYEQVLGLVARGPVRHLGRHEAILAEFTRLLTNMPAIVDEPSRWLCLQAAALSIFGHIAALPANMADLATAYAPIQKALAVMNDSLEQTFDMAGFAREAGCSARHFIRQFRQVTGRSPADWFIQRKMQRASSLLAIPHTRVNEIASRLGYADPLYFSKVFKRVHGMSPEQYRRKLAANKHFAGSPVEV